MPAEILAYLAPGRAEVMTAPLKSPPAALRADGPASEKQTVSLRIDERQGSNHSNSDPLGGCEAILGAVDFLGYGIGPVNIWAYLFFNTDQLYVFLTKSRLR